MRLPEPWDQFTPILIAELPEPLVSDQALRGIPDLDTRQHLRTAVVKAMVMKFPHMRRVQALGEHATQQIKQIHAEADVAALTPLELKKMVAGWVGIEAMCQMALKDQAAKCEVNDEMMHDLLTRWLLVRAETVDQINDRHEIEGFTVVGGIIEPQAKRRPK